jgi:MFS family permease
VPNPFTSLKVLWAKDAATLCAITGFGYMISTCLQASLSTFVMDIYGNSELQAGLLYIPFGVGGMLASYLSGWLLDGDCRTIAHKHGFAVDMRLGDNLQVFPIQQAQLHSVWYFILMISIGAIGCGWSLQARAHISIALVMQFFISLGITANFNICSTLLTDLHPKSPSAAQAANNLIRCSLAGIGLAFLQAWLTR